MKNKKNLYLFIIVILLPFLGSFNENSIIESHIEDTITNIQKGYYDDAYITFKKYHK